MDDERITLTDSEWDLVERALRLLMLVIQLQREVIVPAQKEYQDICAKILALGKGRGKRGTVLMKHLHDAEMRNLHDFMDMFIIEGE